MIYCTYCQDEVRVNTAVFVNDEKFCSPSCYKSWDDDRYRKMMHQEVVVAPVEEPNIEDKPVNLKLDIVKCKECFHALDFEFNKQPVEYFCNETCSTLFLFREETNKIRKNNIFNMIV